MEKTLAMIKPDGVARCLTGEILGRMESQGLRIIALKLLKLEKSQAERFYAVHRERPFFSSLTAYMSSGPVVAVVLEGEDAVAQFRELIGATDPKKAAPGTIRADFGTSIEENTVHGSDSPESASVEVTFYFTGLDLVQRTA